MLIHLQGLRQLAQVSSHWSCQPPILALVGRTEALVQPSLVLICAWKYKKKLEESFKCLAAAKDFAEARLVCPL